MTRFVILDGLEFGRVFWLRNNPEADDWNLSGILVLQQVPHVAWQSCFTA